MKAQEIFKKYAIAVIAALLACSVLGFTGCTPNEDTSSAQTETPVQQSEEEIAAREYLNNLLGNIASADDATLNAALTGEWYTQLQDLGVDMHAIYEILVSRFSYSIDNVSVSGDTASAIVTTSNVDFGEIASVWTEQVMAYVGENFGSLFTGDFSSLGNVDVGAVSSDLVSLLQQDFEDSSVPDVEATQTVELTQGANGWNLTNQNELVTLITAGQDVSSIFNSLSALAS